MRTTCSSFWVGKAWSPISSNMHQWDSRERKKAERTRVSGPFLKKRREWETHKTQQHSFPWAHSHGNASLLIKDREVMALEQGSGWPPARCASRTHLLSHQCQRERLLCHIFGHLAGRATSVPITKLISTQDPKQPFMVHVLPSFGCWENFSSITSLFGCYTRDRSRKRIAVMTLAVAVKCCSEGFVWWVWGSGLVGVRVNAGKGSCGSCSLKLKETGTKTRSGVLQPDLLMTNVESGTAFVVITLLLA